MVGHHLLVNELLRFDYGQCVWLLLFIIRGCRSLEAVGDLLTARCYQYSGCLLRRLKSRSGGFREPGVLATAAAADLLSIT
jgi:hypothetical protein